MIEPMKKTTIVCLAKDQEQSLKQLQKLAAVHVVPATSMAAEELEALKRELAELDEVRFRLDAYRAKNGYTPQRPPETDGRECLKHVREAMDAVRSADERTAALDQAISRLEPWGQFDPAVISRLADRGYHTYLCTRSRGVKFTPPEGAAAEVITEKNNTVYFVVISPREESDLPVALFPLGQDLAALKRERDELASKRAAAEHALIDHAAQDTQLLEAERQRLADKLTFETARHSMGSAAQQLAYLTGYVPNSRLDEVRLAARKNGWAIRYEDVSDDDSEVPTKLLLPKPLRMAQAILDFIGIVPGYREVDVSASLLIFLLFFGGMLIGDAGYGLIFSAAAFCFFLRAKAKRNEQLTEAMRLFVSMSLCVLGWGALTGNWFGLQTIGVPWLKNDDNVKLFCFFLGAGHLTLAHLWKAKAVHSLRDKLGHIGWALFLWANYFTVKALLIDGGDFGTFLIPKWMYIIGTTLVLLCGVNWKSISDVIFVPFSFINSVSDVLSYIRLFAVGLSSLQIAKAFNGMGAGIWEGNKYLIPVGILIILAGHALNAALAVMGVLVHGIRLNTLEFSGHIGVEWSGKPFRAFK